MTILDKRDNQVASLNDTPLKSQSAVTLSESSISELNTIIEKIKKASTDLTAGENGDIGSESGHSVAQKTLIDDLTTL